MLLRRRAKQKGESLTKIDQLTKLAYEGGTLPLNNYTSGGNTKSEIIVLPLSQGLNRLIPTRLGSQFSVVAIHSLRKAKVSIILIEVGNEEHDFFFFDLGSGALANFDGLQTSRDLHN